MSIFRECPPSWRRAADSVPVDERDLAVSNLRNSPAPHDYSPGLWIETLAGMDAFCATWAARARALGWRESELFGLDDTLLPLAMTSAALR